MTGVHVELCVTGFHAKKMYDGSSCRIMLYDRSSCRIMLYDGSSCRIMLCGRIS